MNNYDNEKSLELLDKANEIRKNLELEEQKFIEHLKSQTKHLKDIELEFQINQNLQDEMTVSLYFNNKEFSKSHEIYSLEFKIKREKDLNNQHTLSFYRSNWSGGVSDLRMMKIQNACSSGTEEIVLYALKNIVKFENDVMKIDKKREMLNEILLSSAIIRNQNKKEYQENFFENLKEKMGIFDIDGKTEALEKLTLKEEGVNSKKLELLSFELNNGSLSIKPVTIVASFSNNTVFKMNEERISKKEILQLEGNYLQVESNSPDETLKLVKKTFNIEATSRAKTVSIDFEEVIEKLNKETGNVVKNFLEQKKSDVMKSNKSSIKLS